MLVYVQLEYTKSEKAILEFYFIFIEYTYFFLGEKHIYALLLDCKLDLMFVFSLYKLLFWYVYTKI